jgi:hypothetical protein
MLSGFFVIPAGPSRKEVMSLCLTTILGQVDYQERYVFSITIIS